MTWGTRAVGEECVGAHNDGLGCWKGCPHGGPDRYRFETSATVQITIDISRCLSDVTSHVGILAIGWFKHQPSYQLIFYCSTRIRNDSLTLHQGCQAWPLFHVTIIFLLAIADGWATLEKQQALMQKIIPLVPPGSHFASRWFCPGGK